MLTSSGYVEEAVNNPNAGYLPDLPEWLVVEVPARIDRNGLIGLAMGQLPRGFAGLLRNQVAVHDLTAEAVLTRSRAAALQALLVDPVVGQYRGLEEMLDTMIAYQQPWLGYLR
jgi:alpha-galactosidase